MRKVLLVCLLFCVTSVFADDTPWCGSYESNPDYYFSNNHHSDFFVTLDDNYLKKYGEDQRQACFARKPSSNNWRDDFHTLHNHSYNVDGFTLHIKCWNMNYDNTLVYAGEIIGYFNEDYTELTIDMKRLKKVSDRKRSCPGTPIPLGERKK